MFLSKSLIGALVISPIGVRMIITAVAIFRLYSDPRLTGTLPSSVLARTITAYFSQAYFQRRQKG